MDQRDQSIPTQSIAPPGRARIDAERLLARRRRRIRLMRKRVIAGSVVAFGAAWAAIGYQLVSGHDPALGKNGQAAVSAPASSATKRASRSIAKRTKSSSTARKAATPATTTGSTTTGSTSTGSSSAGSTSTGSASTGSSSTGSSSTSSAQQPAPVTTRQS